MTNRLVQCCWRRQLVAFYLLFRNETTRAGKGKLSGNERAEFVGCNPIEALEKKIGFQFPQRRGDSFFPNKLK
jgi:hypothetical protein